MNRTRLTAIATTVAALAFAAVALAATPKPGDYSGQTQQKRPISLHVNSDRDISHLKVRWLARNCENDANASWGPDNTTYKSTIPVAPDGTFSKSKKYQRTDENGFTGHFTAKIGGAFTKAKAANGTFSIKVRVTKGGDAVDVCRQTMSWSVTHD